MKNQIDKEALEYTRNLYREVEEWYKNADSKAQILLTIDGAFVAFLTGSVFPILKIFLIPSSFLKLIHGFHSY